MGFFSTILNKLGIGGATATLAPAPVSPTAAPAPAPIPMVDVVAQLEKRAAANPQKLNWRTSIVDLLKLLDIDSSFAARKELAALRAQALPPTRDCAVEAAALAVTR